MVLRTFACETLDNGTEYLWADHKVQWTDAKYKAFEVYAGIMIVVYPVDILLLYAVQLFQHHHVLPNAGADKATSSADRRALCGGRTGPSGSTTKLSSASVVVQSC